MRYKKYKPVKKYSILYLLNHQTKTFMKHRDYQTLAGLYNASPSLKTLKFTRKCLTLLNTAGVPPEHLSSFYNSYNLPRHPFFPLFLKIKKEFSDGKKDAKRKKDEYIIKRMNSVLPDARIFIAYLARYEKSLNNRKRFPEWTKFIYPGTKKQADKLTKFSRLEWAELFSSYVERLEKRYKDIDKKYAGKIVSLFVMELPIKKHSEDEIKKQYRMLSKKYHPDVGGDSAYFNLLQKAREVLCG
jgi:hypothetical protein